LLKDKVNFHSSAQAQTEQWNEQSQQRFHQHENPHQHSSARAPHVNSKIHQQVHDHGFQVVKPAYWWRKEVKHSRVFERPTKQRRICREERDT
jgi:hypothetical protein